VVERRNQNIIGMLHCMMKAKKMPAAFCGEAVNTEVFALNQSPMKSLIEILPF